MQHRTPGHTARRRRTQSQPQTTPPVAHSKRVRRRRSADDLLGAGAPRSSASEAAVSAPSPSPTAPACGPGRVQPVAGECRLSLLPFPYSIHRLSRADPPYTLWLHPAVSDRFISARIGAGMVWEADVQRRIRGTLVGEAVRLAELDLLDRPHPLGGVRRPIFVDVGANIGAHAIFALNLGFEVHAFEPMPHNMRLLRCSALANFHPTDEQREVAAYEAYMEPDAHAGAAEQQAAAAPVSSADPDPAPLPRLRRVRPVLNQVALGEHAFDPAAPRVCMESQERNQGHSFVRPHIRQQLTTEGAGTDAEGAGGARGATAEAESGCTSFVSTSSLDDYDARMLHSRRITFLKIDAEGFEAHVLAGMTRLLALRPPRFVFLEFNPAFLRRMQRDPEQVLHTLAHNQYSLDWQNVISAQDIGGIMRRTEGEESEELWLVCLGHSGLTAACCCTGHCCR